MSIYEYDEEKHIRQEREEAMADGLKLGLKKGQQKGELFKITSLVLKKYSKGFSSKETSDMLEEEPSLIEKIYLLRRQFPDLAADDLVEKLLETNILS